MQTDRRPQIGEDTEFLPQPQQACLRTKLCGIRVKCRATDCAQQYCTRREAALDGIRRQRIIARDQCRPTNILLCDFKPVAKTVRNCLKHVDSLLSDFRSNPVAG